MTFDPKFEINDEIQTILREIEGLNAKVAGNYILPEVEASVRYRASVEAVHSSTSIEGNPLNREEVQKVIATEKAFSKEEYAKIEVRNYKKALDYIRQRCWETSDISLNDVLKLHAIITDELLAKSRQGKLRKNPVYIENEKGKVVYEAPEPKLVREELKALLEWVHSQQFSLHPVLIAAILHFQMVAIHPFADGNGRTARALVALYLALAHYDGNGALVLDSYYAVDRAGYYAALSRSSGKNYKTAKRADLTEWIAYFADGFRVSMKVLDADIKMLKILFSGMGERTLSPADKLILDYVAERGAINISTAEALLPELERRSVQRRLKSLVDRGRLKLVGNTHNAEYVMAKKRRF